MPKIPVAIALSTSRVGELIVLILQVLSGGNVKKTKLKLILQEITDEALEWDRLNRGIYVNLSWWFIGFF